jgi:hypothetical protein
MMNHGKIPSPGFFIKRRLPLSNLGWLATAATSDQVASQPARESLAHEQKTIRLEVTW